MYKKALIILIHFAVCIVVQLGFFIHTVFFYDYSVKSIVAWSIIGISIICIDYYVSIYILADKNITVPWITHIADLVLAIPNLALWGYIFLFHASNRDIFKPSHSVYEIVLLIGIILADICLVVERINLINS